MFLCTSKIISESYETLSTLPLIKSNCTCTTLSIVWVYDISDTQWSRRSVPFVNDFIAECDTGYVTY